MSAKKNTKTAKPPKAKAAKFPKAAKKPAKAKADTKPKRTSALDAAAKVLAGAGEPMTTKQMTTTDDLGDGGNGTVDRPRRCDPLGHTLFRKTSAHQREGEGRPVREDRAGEVRG